MKKEIKNLLASNEWVKICKAGSTGFHITEEWGGCAFTIFWRLSSKNITACTRVVDKNTSKPMKATVIHKCSGGVKVKGETDKSGFVEIPIKLKLTPSVISTSLKTDNTIMVIA